MKPRCFNRPPWLPYLLVKDGLSIKYNPDGTGVAAFKVKPIQFKNSMDCKTPQTLQCEGCRWVTLTEPAAQTSGSTLT